MLRKLICGGLLAAMLGAMGSATAGDPAPVPRWPLDLPNRYLTSGFMEYRPGRYHAGLDLKTQSRMGFAVHAAEQGWIVRLRATARAYGRAVYLRTPGGKTYVYAHLSRFSDRLRARIQAAQAVSGTYRTELYFKPGEIGVDQSEILGLTGQSGTAGPHLHFEVRDAKQRPINPLDQGFAVGDTVAPALYAVHAVPMTPEATVEGQAGIMMFGDPDDTALPDTLPVLHLTGPVAFTARMVDYGDLAGYRFEPWQVVVSLDGREVYRARNSTFSFGAVSRSRLEWYDGFSPRERWLFKRSGVDLPGRDGGPWPAGKDGQGLTPGGHEVVITAEDHAGGRTTVVLPLEVGKKETGPSRWRPALVTPVAGADPVLPAGCRLNPFFSRGMAACGFTEIPLAPDRGDPVLEAVSLWTRPWIVPGSALIQALAQHLEPTPWAMECVSGDLPIESAVPVTFPPHEGSHLDPTSDRWPFCRVYRWDGTGWGNPEPLVSTASEVQPPGLPGFRLNGLGCYAVFEDHTAPRLHRPAGPDAILEVNPGPPSKYAGVSPPRWAVIPLEVIEQGSGLDAGATRVTLDGKPLVVEPDFPRDRLLVELPPGTGAGRHELEIELQDGCRNRSVTRVSLDCIARNN